MGTGTSSTSYGVPSNPRVEFASSRSKKENKVFCAAFDLFVVCLHSDSHIYTVTLTVDYQVS